MSEIIGATAMPLLVVGLSMLWLGRQEPRTKADIPMAVIGYVFVLIASAAIGWLIA